MADANEHAFRACRAIAENPQRASHQAVTIYGRAGLGKTHMLVAVAHEINTCSKQKALYLTSRDFQNAYERLVRSFDSHLFLKALLTYSVVLIDDVQSFTWSDHFKRILPTVFEIVRRENVGLIFTTDRKPLAQAWTDAKELHMWLSNSYMVDVHLPDLETRAAIVQQYARREGIDLRLEQAFSIARTEVEDVRELLGLVSQEKAYQSMLACMASAAQNTGTDFTRITPANVIETICSAFDRPFEDVITHSPADQPLNVVTQTTAYMLKRILRCPAETIATVMHFPDTRAALDAVECAVQRSSYDDTYRCLLAFLEKRIQDGL